MALKLQLALKKNYLLKIGIILLKIGIIRGLIE
jgi:hypothetical protein